MDNVRVWQCFPSHDQCTCLTMVPFPWPMYSSDSGYVLVTNVPVWQWIRSRDQRVRQWLPFLWPMYVFDNASLPMANVRVWQWFPSRDQCTRPTVIMFLWPMYLFDNGSVPVTNASDSGYHSFGQCTCLTMVLFPWSHDLWRVYDSYYNVAITLHRT